MARRITSSQIRSRIRQAEAKARQQLRQAENKVKNQLRQAEAKAKQQQRQKINKLNQEIRKRHTARNRAIDAYNRSVRAHNSRVRANRQRLQQALRRLHSQPVTIRFVKLHQSVIELSSAYSRLETVDRAPYLSDLAEQETANSVSVLNALLETQDAVDESQSDITDTVISDQLSQISPDLDDRWRGAIFSLNPINADAARHFCTSTREIVTTILDIAAPDADVILHSPDCQLTDNGTPTRREKIHYCLVRKGHDIEVLEHFVEANIDNVIALFSTLSAGTHGRAGKYSLKQLEAIKVRVEDAIRFMCEIVS